MTQDEHEFSTEDWAELEQAIKDTRVQIIIHTILGLVAINSPILDNLCDISYMISKKMIEEMEQ